MWKVFNLLFGWDYIYWKNTVANGIARVHKSKNNDVWYYRYWITKCIDKIDKEDQVMWLTCKASKYLG